MPESISVVLPYFNERSALPATLRSLCAQNRPAEELILVDNASDDGSEQVARQILSGCTRTRVRFLHEPRPGKTYALACGTRQIRTSLVAFVDADTYYPPEYLERGVQAFETAGPGCATVLAVDVPDDPRAALARRWFIAAFSRLLPAHAFSGGAAQIFRTAAYHAAGGYDPALWNFTLEDHEIINRLRKQGARRYQADFWCRPAARRKYNRHVTWTRVERLAYLLATPICWDWLFYRFLAPRFQARKMYQEQLRRRDFDVMPHEVLSRAA